MTEAQTLLLNNKKSKKVGFKRRDALVIADQIRDYLEERGIQLPHAAHSIFGRGFKVSASMKQTANQEVRKEFELDLDQVHVDQWLDHINATRKKGRHAKSECKLPLSFTDFTTKAYDELARQRIKAWRREHQDLCAEKAIRSFTDRETGEILYDDHVELARAYYALWQCSPATYAIFRGPKGGYQQQGITFTCSKHRIDPVWNYVKSKKLRSNIHAWMRDERIHEKFQPMHLVLTVPHPDGKWMGKSFYAKEMVERFNLMRKHPLWNKYIYGGLQCLEITRKGRNGLHIHIHAMVLQKPGFTRDEVYAFIGEQWGKSTGALKCWYETLYIHRRVNDQDKKSPWILHTDESGNKVWDEDRQEWKKKKFYLDERYEWFRSLPAEEKLNTYVNGVLECIKYHFKYESFKTGKKVSGTGADKWDIELIRDVLKHSRSLRMYDKFGQLYGVKRLSASYIEKQAAAETEKGLEAISADHDGVSGRIINPYTKQPAQPGEYTRVLALPQYVNHYGHQYDFKAIINAKDHDIYYKVRPDIPIRRVIEAIMKRNSKYMAEVLIEADYQRFVKYGWSAPRNPLYVYIE